MKAFLSDLPSPFSWLWFTIQFGLCKASLVWDLVHGPPQPLNGTKPPFCDLCHITVDQYEPLDFCIYHLENTAFDGSPSPAVSAEVYDFQSLNERW